MCSRAGNWQCCVRFGITADLPSVTKAATTDWTAKWSDWEKPTILLFCLFPTVNVFWFWKSMCDCNIFYCPTALKCDSVRCHLHWVRPSEPHALTKNTCFKHCGNRFNKSDSHPNLGEPGFWWKATCVVTSSSQTLLCECKYFMCWPKPNEQTLSHCTNKEVKVCIEASRSK